MHASGVACAIVTLIIIGGQCKDQSELKEENKGHMEQKNNHEYIAHKNLHKSMKEKETLLRKNRKNNNHEDYFISDDTGSFDYKNEVEIDCKSDENKELFKPSTAPKKRGDSYSSQDFDLIEDKAKISESDYDSAGKNDERNEHDHHDLDQPKTKVEISDSDYDTTQKYYETNNRDIYDFDQPNANVEMTTSDYETTIQDNEINDHDSHYFGKPKAQGEMSGSHYETTVTYDDSTDHDSDDFDQPQIKDEMSENNHESTVKYDDYDHNSHDIDQPKDKAAISETDNGNIEKHNKTNDQVMLQAAEVSPYLLDASIWYLRQNDNEPWYYKLYRGITTKKPTRYPEYAEDSDPTWYPDHNPPYDTTWYPDHNPPYDTTWYPDHNPPYDTTWYPDHNPPYDTTWYPDHNPPYDTTWYPDHNPPYDTTWYPNHNPPYDTTWNPELDYPNPNQPTIIWPEDGDPFFMTERPRRPKNIYPNGRLPPTPRPPYQPKPAGGIGSIGKIKNVLKSGVMSNQWNIQELKKANSGEKPIKSTNTVIQKVTNKGKVKNRMCILNSHDEYCIGQDAGAKKKRKLSRKELPKKQ